MKKALLIFLYSLFLALFPLSGMASEQSVEVVSILSLGDSIAFGYGCQPDEVYSYRLYSRIKETLPEESFLVNFQNFGTNGDTTADLLDKVETDDEIQEAVADADFITISIGGNDLLSLLSDILDTYPSGSLTSTQDYFAFMAYLQSTSSRGLIKEVFEAFCTNMQGIIDRLESLAPEATVLLTTIPNPSGEERVASLINAYLTPYNDYIIGGCDRKNDHLLIADSNKAFTDYTGDEILTFLSIDIWAPEASVFDPHPTPAGHSLIAEEHFSLIEPLLQKRISERTTLSPTTPSTFSPTTTQEEEIEPPSNNFLLLWLCLAGSAIVLVVVFLILFKTWKKRR